MFNLEKHIIKYWVIKIMKAKNLEERILFLRKDKKSITEIGKELNIGSTYVYKILKKNNIKTKHYKDLEIVNINNQDYFISPYSKFSKDIVIKIINLREQYYSLKKICKKLNISYTPLCNWYKLNKLKSLTKPKINREGKFCKKCNLTKPINEFFCRVRNGLNVYENCLMCQKEVKNKRNRIYQNKRSKIDIVYKLNQNIGNKLRGIKKDCSKKVFLNYTMQELKEYLESLFEPWMSWNNYGIYNAKKWNDNDSSTWTWQIDHIIPKSTFNYKSVNDDSFKACWSLSNLRPYSAKLNIIEGANRIRHKNQNTFEEKSTRSSKPPLSNEPLLPEAPLSTTLSMSLTNSVLNGPEDLIPKSPPVAAEAPLPTNVEYIASASH
jgi:hypothetical protein